MRYAILSDVHANLEALQAVLQAVARERVDAILCLGDLVGYHAEPNECIALLRELGVRCIAGNHDRAAIFERDLSGFGQVARRAMVWTRARLTGESGCFLQGLPLMAALPGFVLVHAALHPRPNDEVHLSSLARADRSLQVLASGRYGARVCFFGHTHHAAVYERSAWGTARLGTADLQLLPGACYLINPGSVGQPRDGDSRAAFAFFDSEAATVHLRRVAYDQAACLHKARLAGLLDEGPSPIGGPCRQGALRQGLRSAASVLRRLTRR